MSGEPIISWENRDSVLAAWRRAPAIFREEFTTMVEGMGEILVGAVKEFSPSNDGIFVGSVSRSGAIPSPGGLIVQIGDDCAFGEVLEFGRRAGSAPPPSKDLIPWVTSHFDVTEKEAKGIAYVVARKIGRVGFSSAPDGEGKGWGMYKKAANRSRGHWRQIGALVANTQKRIADRMNGSA